MRGMGEEGGRGTGIHEVLVLYVYVYLILRWKKTEREMGQVGPPMWKKEKYREQKQNV